MFGIAIITGFFRDLVLLFSIIFIHELGHYSMARFFNWRVRKIVLLPFGGVAEVDEHGNRPFKEEFLVVIFGPFQHILLIALGFFLAYSGLWTSAFFEKFLAFNLMILMFNLLPIWPLDGGKLLFLAFAYFQPFKRAHHSQLFFSSIFLFLFVCIVITMFTFNLNLLIILMFLAFSIYTEWRHHYYVFLRFLLERYENNKGRGRRQKSIHAKPNYVLEQVLKQFQKGVHHHIVLRTNEKLITTDERKFLDAYFAKKKYRTTLSELFRLK